MFATNPVLTKLVAEVWLTAYGDPLRNTRYRGAIPGLPASVDAFQVMVICDEEFAETITPLGVVGDIVSMPARLAVIGRTKTNKIANSKT